MAWTVDTLFIHFEALRAADSVRAQQRFDAQQAAIDRAIESAAVAAEKMEADNDRRFAGTNEWRETVNDMIASNLTHTEAEATFLLQDSKIEALGKRVESVTTFIATQGARSSGMGATVSYIIGASGFISALASLAYNLLHH